MEKFWKVIEKAGWVIGILTGMATILGWQFNVMTFVKLGIYGSGFCLLTCIFLLANFKYNYIEFKMKKSLVVICTFIFFCLFVFSFSALGATTDKAEAIKELPNTSMTKETKTIESSTQETQEIIKDLKIEELPKEWETVEFNDDYFSKKVEVGSSGNLKTIVKATNGGYLDYSIFSDELNKEVLEKRISSSSTAAPKVEEITSDLSPGSYEIRIGKRDSYGSDDQKEEKVEWKNEFVDFAETATKPNNSIEQAMDMKMNSDIISSFTLTDEVGFYKFETNTSGSLNLIISAYMETLKFELLDKDGQQIESYGGRLYSGTMKEPTTEEKRFDLEPGTYLIKFEKGETGKYTIKNTFEVGSNNTDSKNDEITTAFPINRGEKQELFMSMQDENHYFTFELPEASKIEVIISAEINTLNFEILSSENLLTVKDKNLYLNGSAKDIKTERLEFDLDKGSYILKVGKNNGTGKYSLIIN